MCVVPIWLALPRCDATNSGAQSFFSLVFWISLVNLKRGISLVILVFSLSFPRILWVRQGKKILGNFEVFLDKNQKTKEKKDRVCSICVISTYSNGACANLVVGLELAELLRRAHASGPLRTSLISVFMFKKMLTSQNPRNPEKLKVTPKVTKK